MKIILASLIVILLVFPIVSADIIVDMVNESSGVVFDKPLDIELKDAMINISVNEYGEGRLTATFKIVSNEDKEVNSRVYLKAKGQSCYSECRAVDVTEWTTRFKLYYTSEIPIVERDLGDGSLVRGYVIEQGETLVIENEEGRFAGTQEFSLVPREILVVEIEQDITLPLEYYLDSLSTFSKAEHEKITIRGDNLTIQFNDNYPIKKISENEWVWEYRDINTKDENLKDVLIISDEIMQNTEPKENYFQKILAWFNNLFG